MLKETIKKIDEAMKMHIDYNGNCSDRYLKIMDRLAINYKGAPGIRVSKLCDDYYKAVGVSSLKEALNRLHILEDTEKEK